MSTLQGNLRIKNSSGRSILQIPPTGGTTGMSREALWLDAWSTPQWAKLVIQGESQHPVGHHTQGPQDVVRLNRLPKKNDGRGSPQPSYARESRPNLQADYAIMRMKSASALSEAVAILKDFIHQGIIVDSHIYVEVLQRCFRQKDLMSAKQVLDCIASSGMEQNTYVANNILRVYIGYGNLQEAR